MPHPPREKLPRSAAKAAKAASLRRARRRRGASPTQRRRRSPISGSRRSPTNKGSPQGEASSRILGSTTELYGAPGVDDESFTRIDGEDGAAEMWAAGGRFGSGGHRTRHEDAKPEKEWVLWMALSEEEKRAKGKGKFYNAKQLEWRARRREGAREEARRRKREKREKRAAARLAKARARKTRRSKLKVKVAAKAQDQTVTNQQTRTPSEDPPPSELRSVKTESQATPSAAPKNVQKEEPAGLKDVSASVALSGPLPPLASRPPRNPPPASMSHSPDYRLMLPQGNRSRLKRISISRDNSEQVYKEFNELLYAHDDHKARLFKEQFRGGNPYMKRRKRKSKTEEESVSLSSEEQRALQKLSGKIDSDGHFHCQSRRCGAIVTFDSDGDAFTTCTRCSYLNNRKMFKHVNAPRAETSSTAWGPRTHADLCREKFTRKLQHRFIDQLNGVIHHIGDSVRSGRSPKKSIWKEFDNTQLRLAHPWKAPAAPGPKYQFNCRALSNIKSAPAFTLYAKRHQMRFDNDPDSPER